MELKNKQGRPIEGYEPKSRDRKVRLEPWIDDELTKICRMIGITRAEGIREGILLFIQKIKKRE